MLRRLSSSPRRRRCSLPAHCPSFRDHAHEHAQARLPEPQRDICRGNYKKTSKGIYINVCAKDTKSQFAVGAVVVATNSSGSRSGNLGAVAMGHGTTQCRFGTIPYSSHLKTYVIGYTSHGTVAFKTGLKKIF